MNLSEIRTGRDLLAHLSGIDPYAATGYVVKGSDYYPLADLAPGDSFPSWRLQSVAENAQLIELPAMGNGPHVSTSEASNFRIATSAWPDLLVDITYGDGTIRLAILADAILPDGFASAIVDLAFHIPFLDEQDVAELEHKITVEALINYGLDSLSSEVLDILAGERKQWIRDLYKTVLIDVYGNDGLRDLYFEVQSDICEYPEFDSVSKVDLRIDEIAPTVAEIIRERLLADL